MKKTFLLLITLILSFLLISCNEVKEYEIKYYIGEELYKTCIVKEKEKVEDIEVPEIEYYEFKCWVNKENNEEYDLSLPVKGNLELTAKYEKIANLAGGDEGKIYDFSNLTDEEVIELSLKMVDFFMDKTIVVPFYSTVDLFVLSDRIEYPVALNRPNYELYSKFRGENVFRYVVLNKEKDSFIRSLHYDLLYKGLYSYEYTDDFSNYKLVPYFVEGDPIKVDEKGTKWKVYIKEGFKYSDGTDILFEDFIETYEYGIENCMYPFNKIVNVHEYYKGECSRDDVGLSYNYEEKAIIFEYKREMTVEEVKSEFTSPYYAPTKYMHDVENVEHKAMAEYAFKYQEENVVVYEKNPFYVCKGVSRSFDRIEVYFVETYEEAKNMLDEGFIDYMKVNAEDYQEYFQKDENVLKIDHEIYGLRINLTGFVEEKQPILYNQNFRKALYYGVNREELFGDFYNSCDYVIKPNSITDSINHLLYPREQETNVYNVDLALEYYVKSLNDLYEKGYFSSEEQFKIELEVIYPKKDTFPSSNIEETFEQYQKLFNSQKIYPNVQIVFNVNKLDDSDVYYKLTQGDYDIALDTFAANNSVNGFLEYWSTHHSSSGVRFYAPFLEKVYKNNLIEFRGEYFTYRAMCSALSGKKVFIVNGEYVNLQ